MRGGGFFHLFRQAFLGYELSNCNKTSTALRLKCKFFSCKVFVTFFVCKFLSCKVNTVIADELSDCP